MTADTAALASISTRASLYEGLLGLGVARGSIVLLHSSMRAIGWVLGGAPTVVHAMLDVLGPDGTLVVYTQTAENRCPSRWTRPQFPRSMWARIRADMPAYDPVRTPSSTGRIAECVRNWPGAQRSLHPQTSFAAIGPAAAELLADHELESPLGERSPLRKMEIAGARVLLLGVGWDRCTAFHLAEYRLPGAAMYDNGCSVATETGRAWVTYRTTRLSAHDFGALGAAYERQRDEVTVYPIGQTQARLAPIDTAISFAGKWLACYRQRSP